MNNINSTSLLSNNLPTQNSIDSMQEEGSSSQILNDLNKNEINNSEQTNILEDRSIVYQVDQKLIYAQIHDDFDNEVRTVCANFPDDPYITEKVIDVEVQRSEAIRKAFEDQKNNTLKPLIGTVKSFFMQRLKLMGVYEN